MKKEEILDTLDTMLLRTIADIHEEFGEDEFGEELKEKIRRAYKEIVALIKKLKGGKNEKRKTSKSDA